MSSTTLNTDGWGETVVPPPTTVRLGTETARSLATARTIRRATLHARRQTHICDRRWRTTAESCSWERSSFSSIQEETDPGLLWRAGIPNYPVLSGFYLFLKRGAYGGEASLQVRNQIIHVLNSDREAYELLW